jgi:hypothetical protein
MFTFVNRNRPSRKHIDSAGLSEDMLCARAATVLHIGRVSD